MSKAIWSGAITFGPVHIPVKMYSATEDREGITFHQVRKSDGSRIQQKRVAAADGEQVAYADIAKGFMWGEQVVVFTDEDMASVAIPTTKRIEIEHFCTPDEVRPILFEKHYYLVPDKSAERAFWLLRSAMLGRVGIGRVVIRSRERTVMLTARVDGIVMTTLRASGDVREMPEYPVPTLTMNDAKIEQEITLATQLVEAMVDTFKPEENVDRWAEAVRKLAEQKVNGVKAETPAPEAEPNPGMDLIATLQAAVAEIKAAKSQKAGE